MIQLLPYACVIGSTKILLGNYTEIEIKDVKIGDEILQDKLTGKVEIVARVVKNNVHALGRLIPKNLIGNKEDIVLSSNHPVWTNEDKNRILPKNIKGTKKVLIKEPLYNIQFENFGTFYASDVKMDSFPPVNNIDPLPLENYFNKEKYKKCK